MHLVVAEDYCWREIHISTSLEIARCHRDLSWKIPSSLRAIKNWAYFSLLAAGGRDMVSSLFL